MGGLSSSLGFAGGEQGSGRSLSQGNTVNPVTGQMTTDAYNNSQTGLTNQANFLSALQAQNGIGNQSSVFNQLQNTANGTGANPAQAQLAQSTGQNVANQSALMAGQRGSSANSGLMARQIASQGANTQQQSAGQAATLQANQSLNALNSMGTLASNQVSNQASATNAYSSAAQGEQSNLYNMLGGVNSSNASITGGLNSANAALIGQSVNNQNQYMSNITSAMGSGMSMMADGGKVQKFAEGGYSYGGTQAASGPGASSTAAITADKFDLANGPGGKPAAADPSKDPKAAQQGDQAQPKQGLMSKMGGMFSSTPQAAEPSATSYQGDPNFSDRMSPYATSNEGSGLLNQASGHGPSTGGPAYSMPMMAMADGGDVSVPDAPAPTSGNQEDAKAPETALTAAPPAASAAPVAEAAPQQVSSDPNAGPQSTFGQSMSSDAPASTGSYGGTQAAAGPGASSTSAITSEPINLGLTGSGGPSSSGGGSGGGGGSSGMSSMMSMLPMLAMAAAHGGKVPALVSPGEQYLPPKDVKKVTKEGKNPLSVGERIPGTPKVKGNSYANDIVPKKLETGGIVIPNSVMQSSDPAGNAAKFIQATLAKSKAKK